MAPFLSALIPILRDWIVGAFERRQRRADAKTEAEVEKAKAEAEVYRARATADISWDAAMAEATRSSWKDEYLTILLSLPLIIAFFPGGAEVVRRGFAALHDVPEWYVVSLGAAVAASFGVREVIHRFARRGMK